MPCTACRRNPVAKRTLGQGLFSLAVRDASRGTCAITGEHSLPALEAAHILPYGRGGEHRVDNGLLLRSDLHRLYDRGYVTVTPDHVFRVSDRLRDEFPNGRSCYGLDGALVFDELIAENRDVDTVAHVVDQGHSNVVGR